METVNFFPARNRVETFDLISIVIFRVATLGARDAAGPGRAETVHRAASGAIHFFVNAQIKTDGFRRLAGADRKGSSCGGRQKG